MDDELWCAACLLVIAGRPTLTKGGFGEREQVQIKSLDHAREIVLGEGCLLTDDVGMNYGLLPATIYKGTAYCFSHAIVEMTR